MLRRGKDIILDYALIFILNIKAVYRRQPPAAWKSGNSGDVILIPGFHENWVYMEYIGNRLNAKGYRIHAILETGRNFGTIGHGVATIKRYIESHDITNAILIGHSKGGLIAKSLLDDPSCTDRIARVFTINTPYRGSLLCRARVLNLKEMAPDSHVLHTICRCTTHPEKIVNIRSRLDNQVIPNRSMHLDGVMEELLSVSGHTYACFTDELIRTILRYL